MMNRTRMWLSWQTASVVLLLLFLAVLPLRPGRAEYDYFIFIVMRMLLLAMFAMGFNLLFGYTGLLSFGHAGFYAVGAYVCAKILVTMEHPSLLAGVVPGVLAAGLAALVIGYLCVRSTRIYFSMLTLSFGMMIWAVVHSWDRVTGGDDGLSGVPRAPLFGIDMLPLERYYYFVLVIWVLAIWLLYRLVHSPLGLTLQGIRDSENRVAFTGVSVRKYRLISFTVSGLYAGLAGSLAAPLFRSVTPTAYAHWTKSAEPVLASLLGGIHTFAGPIVGAFVLDVVQDRIIGISATVTLPWRGEVVIGEYWPLVFGTIVVVLVLGFRGGVVSVLQDQLMPRLRLRLRQEVAS
ncbi:MAG: branched-chain amino acid ABC transporter permease [Anaerolineae bacterium]